MSIRNGQVDMLIAILGIIESFLALMRDKCNARQGRNPLIKDTQCRVFQSLASRKFLRPIFVTIAALKYYRDNYHFFSAKV